LATISEPALAAHGPLSAHPSPTGPDPLTPQLYRGVPGHFEGIIHLDAEVTDRAFQLRMSKYKLHGPQILQNETAVWKYAKINLSWRIPTQ
jgi:hypothetical protein